MSSDTPKSTNSSGISQSPAKGYEGSSAVQHLETVMDSPDRRRHHFNVWSTIGVNYSLIGTPLSIGTYLAFNIGVGGSPVYIFGYLLAAIFQMLICISLAEMAAAYPHSSGQVYWTSIFAPRRYSRALSYWVGAFSSAAWFFWTAGTYLFAAQLLLATASAAHPGYTSEPYQLYLCYIAAAAVAVLFNIQLFRFYTIIMRGIMFYVNISAIIVLVTLLARASPKQSAQTVFVDFVNATGWSSDGFVFLLGCLPGITALNGFDSATHVTDEIPDPARQVPKVMIWTYALSSLSGLPMTIIFMFCVVNGDNLLAPIGGQPITQLFLDSTASLPLTMMLMSIYIIMFYIASGCMMTTFSRVLWSLAREQHLFLSPWLCRLGGRHELPEHAIYVATLLASLIGLLCLGPSTALNAILGSAAVCFFCSYMIPIACLLYDRSPLRSKTRTVDLGPIGGTLINILAMAWMLLLGLVLLFPQYIPVAPATMNYTIAVLAGVVLVYSVNWICYARKHYRDPRDAPSGISHALGAAA
ncbi:amino acid transporter [Pochonia chlamydosporia 170]|uniref:Amino acid transporter n=1 Tax=Pochonia chlamydosporia 170 TaxID=1380566 RepID=A0A179F125_METCM|nr:amino acid transporter [Pochonia chlamydosporia 170]OAQ59108.1 amino acid transporter [Pochonia chlamydosporia 170]